jgi:2-keto-3-deoxy-L-rhamnonate aldolase RhmA
MRPNPIKQRLADGGTSYGTMAFEFFTPGFPQIVAAAGADFLLLDMEHSGIGMETVKAQIALCRGLEVAPMVRVPATQYHFIARALDAGALGVMVPMVETVEQAQSIVAATRYPPAGRRGAAFGVAAHDDYRDGPVGDKIAAIHERTLTICLIETAEGLANVDAIAAVPGVDVCWLGHFDMTNFLGIPAQFDHPRYQDAVERILAACRRHGKTPGFMASDAKWAREYQARGFRMIAYSLDVILLRDALAAGLAGLRASQ